MVSMSEPHASILRPLQPQGKDPVRKYPARSASSKSLDKFKPMGEASCRTHDENGLSVWTLRIGKEEIPGRWVIVDREFRPAE